MSLDIALQAASTAITAEIAALGVTLPAPVAIDKPLEGREIAPNLTECYMPTLALDRDQIASGGASFRAEFTAYYNAYLPMADITRQRNVQRAMLRALYKLERDGISGVEAEVRLPGEETPPTRKELLEYKGGVLICVVAEFRIRYTENL